MDYDNNSIIIQPEKAVDYQNTKKSKLERKPGELIFLGFLLVFTSALLWSTFSLKGILDNQWSGPSSVPQVILFSMIIIVITIFGGLKKRGYKEGSFNEIVKYLICPEIIILLVMVIIYAIILPIIHFKAASIIFLFATMYLLERSRPLNKFLISAGVLIVIILIFEFLMKVVLP